jgi:hypothetical protein
MTAETPMPLHDLSFGDDRSVRAAVRDELVATLAQGDAERAEAMRQALDARDIHVDFARELGTLALDSHDLGDVMAAYWIVMWTTVHEADLPDADAARAVRTQVGQVLASSVATRDARQRQLTGDAMLFEMLVTIDLVREARAAGATARLRAMADSAQRNMLNRQALNLRKMRLTRSGLVRF